MIEPSGEGPAQGGGGHQDREAERAAMVDRIAAADRSDLAALWRLVVAEWADEASGIWLEALSATDASET